MLDAAHYERLRDSIYRTIWDVLDPLEARIESDEQLPLNVLIPALRDCGALGLLVPAEYGGSGLTIEQYLPIISEFAKIHGGIRVFVHVWNSFAHALNEFGNSEQRQRVLPGVAAGEACVAFALTEPDHGTGLDLGTTATPDGKGYRLDGRKWLITNSDVATHFLVLAKTGPTELSTFLVDRNSSGLTIEPLPETMGCKGGEHGQLTFERVRVTEADLVGHVGAGEENLERALETSRLFIAASSLGTAQRALELSVEHANRRTTFGKPLAARQAIQRYLAEMGTDVYALRHMLTDAARKVDCGKRIPFEASACKLFGLEMVGRVTDRALLIHGGIGYTRRTPVERLYRDARLNWLEEGPPTVQYLVAARELAAGYRWSDAYEGAVRA